MELPGDIIYSIAKQSPDAFGQLSRGSRRYYNVTMRALLEVCNSPPTLSEVLRLIDLSKINTFKLSLPLTTPIDKQQTYYFRINNFSDKFSIEISTYNINNLTLDIEYESPKFYNLQDLKKDLRVFWNQGFTRLTPFHSYKIYKDRLSCMQIDPNYAKKMAIQDFWNEVNYWGQMQNYASNIWDFLLSFIFDYEITFKEDEDIDDLYNNRYEQIQNDNALSEKEKNKRLIDLDLERARYIEPHIFT